MAQRYEITDSVQKTLSIGAAANLLQVGSGLSAQVKDLQGNNLTVYQAETGSSTFSNPLTTSSTGSIEGWVEAPDFDIAISGAGVTTYTQKIRNSPQGTFNVKSYGAKGDGSTDDTAAIQAAITAANTAGSGHVVGDRKDTYRLGTTLSWTSNVHLRDLTLDASTTTKVGSVRRAVYAQGSVGSSLALSANANKGEYTVTLSDASSLAAGDWVVLATEGANFYPYGAAVNSDRGEIKQIRSKATNTLTFETAIYDNYTTANSAFVKKVTFVENISATRVKVIGANTAADGGRGIDLEFVNGFRIDDCEFDKIDIYCVVANMAIRGSISGNRIKGVYYDGVTGSTFYGIALINAAQWIRVENNHGELLRHLYVNTASSTGQGYWGAPRHIVVDGNVAENMEGGAGGRSWAFEHHGPGGEDIIISNNVCDGCYGGVAIRGPGVTFKGNTIRNWYQRAIELHTDLVDARDIVIEGNVIEDRSVEGGGAASPYPIIGDLDSATTVENVVIKGNVIKHTATSTQAILMNAAAATNPMLTIEGNVITGPGGTTNTTYLIESDVPNTVIEGNKLYETRQGIYAAAQYCVVKNNVLKNIAAAGNLNAGIFTDQANVTITGNDVDNFLRCYNVASGATNCLLVNNTARRPSTDARAFDVLQTLSGLEMHGNIYVGETKSLASAATVTLPSGNGKRYTITGTTTITSISATGVAPDRVVTLVFAGILTFTDGSNLKLNGNFVTSADDAITLIYDQSLTAWVEMGRSAN